MCGFLQVIQRHEAVDRDRFNAALALMKHRGPDDTGTSYHETTVADGGGTRTVHVASGHQRLSILDLDSRSAQPFQDGSHSLLYNGEIYNIDAVKSEDPLAGMEFRTTGDTEVLFHGLRLEGIDFLRRLNGMWAATFLDTERNALTATRDRYGKKPLFYFRDDDTLIFSSTIQAVHHYLGRDPRLKTEALHSYLIYGKMFPPAGTDTHLAGLSQVPPAHVATADLASWTVKVAPYWELEPDGLLTAPDQDELAYLLEDAVRLRLVSDRPVGLLLSGGIDSSLILSILHYAGLHENVRCFIGETGRSEDAAYAKQCAAQLGIEPTIIDLSYGGDTFRRYLDMCRHHEKAFPFLGNATAMAEMYEHVSGHDVPVVLDGSGGDEIFGGYWDRQFPPAVCDALRRADVGWLATSIMNSPSAAARNFKLLRKAFRKSRFTNRLRRRGSPIYRTLGLDRIDIPSTDPLEWPRFRFLDALLADVRPGGRLAEWIWHNDRNAMMSGIENRSPLLDYRLAKFIGTGYRHKFRGAWNKHELRSVFDRFVPLPTQWRKEKQGFRWAGRQFIQQNRGEVLDLIAASHTLQHHLDVAAFTNQARRSDTWLRSSLTARLLCLAGLEETIGIKPE